MNEAGQICGRCSANNLLTARRCEVCGATLEGTAEEQEHTVMGETSEDLEQEFVPPGQREAVRSFEDEAEAELAAGYLRANGIPAEVGKMMIPGLPYGMALWVRKSAVAAARQLLDEAEASAKGPQPVE